jgi:hypothetical protein
VPAGVKVLGIELGSKTLTYDWVVDRSQWTTFERASLTQNYAELVNPWQAFTALRRLLRGHGCQAVFLPSYWPAPNLALLGAAKSLGLPI